LNSVLIIQIPKHAYNKNNFVLILVNYEPVNLRFDTDEDGVISSKQLGKVLRFSYVLVLLTLSSLSEVKYDLSDIDVG
jgi:hypothetical protein